MTNTTLPLSPLSEPDDSAAPPDVVHASGRISSATFDAACAVSRYHAGRPVAQMRRKDLLHQTEGDAAVAAGGPRGPAI